MEGAQPRHPMSKSRFHYSWPSTNISTSNGPPTSLTKQGALGKSMTLRRGGQTIRVVEICNPSPPDCKLTSSRCSIQHSASRLHCDRPSAPITVAMHPQWSPEKVDCRRLTCPCDCRPSTCRRSEHNRCTPGSC